MMTSEDKVIPASGCSRPVYVAGYHGTPERAAGVAATMRDSGYRVTSRWHDLLAKEPVGDRRLSDDEAREVAALDIGDVGKAGAILVLWDERCHGALVELGAAWARGHVCVVVMEAGEYITPMARLAGVQFVNSIEQATTTLAGRKGAR